MKLHSIPRLGIGGTLEVSFSTLVGSSEVGKKSTKKAGIFVGIGGTLEVGFQLGSNLGSTED